MLPQRPTRVHRLEERRHLFHQLRRWLNGRTINGAVTKVVHFLDVVISVRGTRNDQTRRERLLDIFLSEHGSERDRRTGEGRTQDSKETFSCAAASVPRSQERQTVA